MGNEYALSRLAADGRPRIYTYSQPLAERVMFTLGDDRIVAVTTDDIGEDRLYCVTLEADALDELESVLVTHGAVEVDPLPLPPAILESLEADALDGAMRRHPAGGPAPTLYIDDVSACAECRRISRLAMLAAGLGLVSAVTALVALVVAQ